MLNEVDSLTDFLTKNKSGNNRPDILEQTYI